jgi:hypothetical protein
MPTQGNKTSIYYFDTIVNQDLARYDIETIFAKNIGEALTVLT